MDGLGTTEEDSVNNKTEGDIEINSSLKENEEDDSSNEN